MDKLSESNATSDIDSKDEGEHEKVLSQHSPSSGSSEAPDEAEAEVEPEEPKLHNLTESMTEILDDIEPPLTSKLDLSLATDFDEDFLKKAAISIRQNFTEAKVMGELRKLYDLYEQSQVQNALLSGKCQKFLDKIDKYEARQKRDPRVMNALRMAERHRQDRETIFEEKKELETDLIDAKMEVKHTEDALKVKLKELAKQQDEIKKLREIEKNAESFETQLIRKENELQTVKQKCEDDMEVLKASAKRELTLALVKTVEHRESKVEKLDHELMTAYKKEQHMKIGLLKDIETKQRLLDTVDKDRKTAKEHLEDCRQRKKHVAQKLRQLIMTNTKVRKEKRKVVNEVTRCLMKYTSLKNEIETTKSELKSSQAHVFTLKCKVKKIEAKNAILNRKLKSITHNLAGEVEVRQSYQATSSRLDKDIRAKNKIIIDTNHEIKGKQTQYEYLYHRYNKLDKHKRDQAELLRVSQANTLVLIKEVTKLQQDVQHQELINEELRTSKTRLRSKLGVLKNHYYEALQDNRLVTRQKEMQECFANQMEQDLIEVDKQLNAVVRANIQLYCQNTTQEEIAVLQNNQFKIKEKETNSLDLLNLEKDRVISRLEDRDRKKTLKIEQLDRDLLVSNTTLAEYKQGIKNLTDENQSMKIELASAASGTQRSYNAMELLRRQRDLFGSRLLQAQTELRLVRKELHVHEMVMKNSQATHRTLQNDLKILRLEIKNMRRKLKTYEGNAAIMESLRQDLATLMVTLELEKAKGRALAESRQPLIHRWRAVLAADPSKYELMVKTHKLTQRLIYKTTENTEKEMIIMQKDHHFLDMQSLLARRTVPSLDDEMTSARTIIKQQEKQIKALQGELNMSFYDLSLKSEVIKTQEDEVREAKKKVVVQQRINNRLKSKAHEKKPLPPICPKRDRMFGGGFCK